MKKIMYLFMTFGVFLTMVCQPVQAEETVLQPGPEDGMDVWITSVYDYDDDYGVDNEQLQVGGWADYYYTLIRFNLSGLPSDVASAKIYLYSFPYGDRRFSSVSMYLDRIAEPWDEDTGWFTMPSSVNLSTIPIPIVDSWYVIDITDLYNSWQDGTYENHGIQLRPTDVSAKMNAFYSSDYMDDPSLRPMLVLNKIQGPDLNLPLPANKSWLLTVEAGGKDLWGGIDPYHTGDGYYSLDFDDITEENGQLTDVVILAAGGGKVIESRYHNAYGYTLVIDHDSPYDGTGYTTRYAHFRDHKKSG